MGVINCYYSVYRKLFNIKLAWFVKSFMDVLHGYCFKSVCICIHKQTLSLLESLMVL